MIPCQKLWTAFLKSCSQLKRLLTPLLPVKRSKKSSDEGPRPALDQERFTVFMDIVLASCEASRKDIVEKVQNVIKTTRKKHKTSGQL